MAEPDGSVHVSADKQCSKKRSGKFCCAGGCTNTHLDGVSLHAFPSELKRPAIRKKWIKFIRDEQVNFTAPTRSQYICERHFTPECYPRKYALLESMGKKEEIKRKDLNADAVPTIHTLPRKTSNHHHDQTRDDDTACASKKRRLTVARKLNISRMMNPTFHYEEDTQRNSMEFGENDEQNDGQINEGENNGESLAKNALRSDSSDNSVEYVPSTRSVGLQVKARAPHRSKYIQTCLRPDSRSAGIQCNMAIISKEEQENGKIIYPRNFSAEIAEADVKEQICQVDEFSNYDEEDYTDEEENEEEEDDFDFIPPTSPTSPSDEEFHEELLDDSSESHWYDSSYIVYGSQLLELFSACPKCDHLCNINATHKGSMLTVTQECMCGMTRRWSSQPFVGSYPAGNLDISAGILYSGSIPSKALRFLEQMNVKAITSRTYFNHQQAILYPSILGVWRVYQSKYFQTMRSNNMPICIGGDGRCDTPGHSAKYCSYTILDVNYMVVADIQLIQSNEVKSSCHMEKEGLVRCIGKLKEQGLEVGELVTDRHPQITKFVREEMPNTKHFFDVWHVSKGLKKKLVKISSLKDCASLQPWIQSITNHLYWVPVSTPSGEEDVIVEKWLSLLNHITNKHDHSGPKFPKCLHGPIPDDRQRQWLDPSSKVFVELEKCIGSTRVKNDIKKLSPGPQTAALEGFHSVLNHFAPKMIGFSYEGMLSRYKCTLLKHFLNSITSAYIHVAFFLSYKAFIFHEYIHHLPSPTF